MHQQVIVEVQGQRFEGSCGYSYLCQCVGHEFQKQQDIHQDCCSLSWVSLVRLVWNHARIFYNMAKPSISCIDPSFTLWSFKEREEVDAVHDWVFSDISFVVHEHEPIERSQESCSLQAIPIEFVWVNAFESVCFVFLIILRKVLKSEGIVSGTVRSAWRFVACSLRWLHPKGSKDIFVFWFVVFIIVFIARGVVEWSGWSLSLLFFNQGCCSCYSCCKWFLSLWFRWSFSMRWWSRRFSTLFKEDEINSREWVVFESKFLSSQSKVFEFVSSDAYFKPYAINVADRYQCIVKSSIVACIGCSSFLTT